MYHEIESGSPSGYPYALGVERFRRQIQSIQRGRFKAVTLQDLRDAMMGIKQLPPRPVILTFDDGYLGVARHALPILREHGISAVLFAVADKIGGTNDWDRKSGGPEIKLMGESEIRELLLTGWELGAHTLSHPRLTEIQEEQASKEISLSREKLQTRFQVPVGSFSFPYGAHNPRLCQIVRASGYRNAVTIFSSAPDVASDPFRMRRVFPHAGDNSLTLRIKLSKFYLRLVAWRDQRKYEARWPE